MKTTKKVLGIVLAVAMLLNVFALGVFAAYPDDTAVKLYVTSDKDTYAAGETITFTVWANATEEIGDISLASTLEFGYNSAVLAPLATTDVAADHGVTAAADKASGFATADSIVVIDYETMSDFDATQKANYGWDKLIMLGIAENATPVYVDGTGNTPVELYSFQMKVLDTAADGSYTFGVSDYCFGNWNGYIGSSNFGSFYGGTDNNPQEEMGASATYGFEAVPVTFSIGAGKIIFHDKAQYNTKLTTADVATLGFVGKFDKNDIGGFTFVEGSSTTLANVTAVGVTLDIAGVGTQTKTSDALYLMAGTTSTYNYRALLNDLDLTQYGDAKITATYFVTFDKAGVSTTEYSEPVEFTANGIING